MITSRSTAKHRKLAQQAGVDHYLTKPVDSTTLKSTIDYYFNTPTTTHLQQELLEAKHGK